MAKANLSFIFLALVFAKVVGTNPKCDTLVLAVLSPKNSDEQVLKDMTAHVTKSVGLGNFPQSADLMENLRNFSLRPLTQVLGINKLAKSDLASGIIKTVNDHLASAQSKDFVPMFAKIKDLYLQSVIGECPKVYDLELMKEVPELIEKYLATLPFNEAKALKTQFSAAQEFFNKEINTAKALMTEFECNCRREHAGASLKTVAPFIIYHLDNDRKDITKPEQAQAFILRVKQISRMIFELEPKVDPRSQEKGKYDGYLGYIDGLINDNVMPLAEEEGERKQMVHQIGLQMIQEILKDVRNFVPSAELSTFLLDSYHSAFTSVFGPDIDYQFFSTDVCPQFCTFDFKTQKIRSQLQLAGLAMAHSSAEDEEAETVDLEENQVAEIINNFSKVFLFEPALIDFLSNYGVLISFDFLISSTEEATRAAKLTFLKFLNEVAMNEELEQGPQQFDKFLDQELGQGHLKGFYHLVKVWNLVSFANEEKLDYLFEWKEEVPAQGSQGQDHLSEARDALKVIAKQPKGKHINAVTLFNVYNLKNDQQVLDYQRVNYDDDKELQTYTAENQGVKLKVQVKPKRKVFSLVDCKEVPPTEEEGVGDRYVITENKKTTETDKAGYLNAIDECKKPKFKIHKHFLKNCKPDTQEIPSFTQPSDKEAEQFFFVDEKDNKQPTDKETYEQAVADCINPPSYVVRTHTVDYCMFDTAETTHKGRPKPDQRLDIYQEIITNEQKEVVETIPLTKEAYEQIESDCKTPKLVESTKITYDDEDCKVISEEKTPYKRKLPPGVKPFYYFVKFEDGIKQMTDEDFKAFKEECDHPKELVSRTNIVDDDDCSFNVRPQKYSRRFPKGVSAEMFAMTFKDKETGLLKEVSITEKEYIELREGCINPVKIPVFTKTVKNICQFDIENKVVMRRLPPGVEKEMFYEITDEAEPKQVKLTKEQFEKIEKDCDNIIVKAITTILDDESCDEHNEIKEYRRKLPYNVLEHSYTLLYADENGAKSQKPITADEYKLMHDECEHPKIFDVKKHTLDEDCAITDEFEKFERRLPKGYELEMYLLKKGNKPTVVKKTEFDSFNEECDKRVFYTKVIRVDEDCKPSSRDVEHHRFKPKNDQLETYAYVSMVDGNEVEKLINKDQFERLMWDCAHPKILTSTTYIVDDDTCLSNLKVETYQRKLPAGVEPEYWFKVVGGVKSSATKSEYDAIKESCDNPITVFSHEHTINDETCEQKTKDVPHKRRLPKDVEENSYFIIYDKETTSASFDEYNKVKLSCDQPATVFSHNHTINDDTCEEKDEDVPHSRRLPPNVQENSYFIVYGKETTPASFDEYSKVKLSCDQPATVFSHEHTINDETCDQKTKDVPHKRRLPPNVQENSYFIIYGKETTPASFDEYNKVKLSCDQPATVFSHEHTINDETCDQKTKDVPHKRRLPKDVEENSYFIIYDKETTSASFDEYNKVKQSCDTPKKILTISYIVSNCEFFTEEKEYSRRLPPKVEMVNYFLEELDNTREPISETKYNAIKTECDKAKPITVLETYKKTKNLFILDRCKVTFHVPTGKVTKEGNPEKRDIVFVIISGKVVREVSQVEFSEAQRRCSFHGVADEDVYPDTENVPQFVVQKHVLKPDCTEELVEERYEGARPADHQPETWVQLVSKDDTTEERQLATQTIFEQEKAKCLENKPRENRIPELPRRRNEVDMVRGALPEEQLDAMRDAPEFVDHLGTLRTIADLADTDGLSDDEFAEYLKKNPMVYDPVNDEYIRITFVQVARHNSDCLTQFEF